MKNLSIFEPQIEKHYAYKKTKHVGTIKRYNLAKFHVSSTFRCLSLNSNVGTFALNTIRGLQGHFARLAKTAPKIRKSKK